MVKLFVKFQKTNAKFRILQIFAPSSFILKKCQQIENGVKLCKIPYLYIIFQNFTKKCTICFTSTLSADILSNFLVCYGVYICKIQADNYLQYNQYFIFQFVKCNFFDGIFRAGMRHVMKCPDGVVGEKVRYQSDPQNQGPRIPLNNIEFNIF